MPRLYSDFQVVRPRFPFPLTRSATEDQVSRLLFLIALVPGAASAGIALILILTLLWR